MNKLTNVAFGIAVGISSSVLAPALTYAETPADAVVMARQIDDLNTLDPAECYEISCHEIISNIYSRLIRYNPENPSELIGDAAESWTVSPDGKTIEFKLRPDLVFESGKPVSAEDAAFSLQRVVLLDKAPAFLLAQFGWTKDNVMESVKALDDRTLSLTLVAPIAPSLALNVLGAFTSSIVEKQVAEANATDGDLGNQYLKAHSATGGPYKLAAWRPQEVVILEANGPAAGADGAPQRVVIRHIPETATQRLLLEKGDIDIARNLSSDQLAAVAKNPDLRVDRFTGSDTWYVAMNMAEEHLASPKVREALKYLVDYEGMTKSFLADRFIVQQSFLPTGMFGALAISDYKLDVERAKSLLAEAGFPDGFELTLDVPNSSPYIDIAQSMQQTMAQAGVKLSLVTGDLSAVITKFRARQHELVLVDWSPDYLDPHTNANTFAKNLDNSDDSKQRTIAWRNHWDIPELSQRTLAAAKELDTDSRKREYAEIQTEVHENGPLIVMFQSVPAVAARADVSGFRIGVATDLNLYAPIRKQ